ncbi:transcriptional regulator, partial [Amycolatopsis sp. SID8362]|nr:transcriptional regulator [Amycolatopsis sp. SID8362]NED41671.1 transcriptional regulator [Amycolatopsis sp. SID8362]
MDVERTPGRRGRVAQGPVADTGPVAAFARRLWELKRAAGDPSYDR